MYSRTNCPTVVATAPNARNTALNPMTNKTEFNPTARILFPSRCFNSSTPEPEISEMYPGTKGSTQGDRNEINPAVNAAIDKDHIEKPPSGIDENVNRLAHCLIHEAPSIWMNSFVPFRPVSRSQNGPLSSSIRSWMLKNGQHSRSPAAHSATIAMVFVSEEN